MMETVVQKLCCTWLYKTLFIKHSKLSAGSNKTLGLLCILYLNEIGFIYVRRELTLLFIVLYSAVKSVNWILDNCISWPYFTKIPDLFRGFLGYGSPHFVY